MGSNSFVYIMASRRNGILYVGVTSDLKARVHRHRTGEFGGFTERYDVKRLVYFEAHSDIEEAILREKKLKRSRRAWKIALIEKGNPTWPDLWLSIQ